MFYSSVPYFAAFFIIFLSIESTYQVPSGVRRNETPERKQKGSSSSLLHCCQKGTTKVPVAQRIPIGFEMLEGEKGERLDKFLKDSITHRDHFVSNQEGTSSTRIVGANEQSPRGSFIIGQSHPAFDPSHGQERNESNITGYRPKIDNDRFYLNQIYRHDEK